MAKRKRFGEILVEAGVVDAGQLDKALVKQKGTGSRLGQVLEEMGVVTEQDIAAALGRQFGFKTVANIAGATFSKELLAVFDADTARKKMLFPLKREGKTLFLAMVNPLDIDTIDTLSFRTGFRIIPCVTTPTEIQSAINRHYLTAIPEKTAKGPQWSVLVVDDQALVRSAAAAALKKAGYRLLEAENGADGLMIALEEKPHLVIFDTVMPRMDGYQMLRAIQANPVIRHIPAIAMSSKSTPEEEARLLDMGCFDFIPKPINPIRLLARTRRVLKIVYGETQPSLRPR